MNRIDGNDRLPPAGVDRFDLREALSEIKKDVEKLIDLFSQRQRRSPFDDGSEATKKFSPELDLPHSTIPVPKNEAVATAPLDRSDSGIVNVVDKPIVVDGGVFDGKGATFTASSTMGKGDQSETQRPVFILRNGATLRNVDIGENGADGIHVYNGATLQNVNWKDVGEDALTVKSPGDVFIEGGSARGAADKVFQLNADTNFHVSNFTADGFQTFIRTNGGKQIDADVTVDGGSFANGKVLFRTDSSVAHVNLSSDISTSNVKNSVRHGDDVTPI